MAKFNEKKTVKQPESVNFMGEKAKIELNIFLLFSYIPFIALPATAQKSPHTKQVRGIMNTLSHFS